LGSSATICAHLEAHFKLIWKLWVLNWSLWRRSFEAHVGLAGQTEVIWASWLSDAQKMITTLHRNTHLANPTFTTNVCFKVRSMLPAWWRHEEQQQNDNENKLRNHTKQQTTTQTQHTTPTTTQTLFKYAYT